MSISNNLGPKISRKKSVVLLLPVLLVITLLLTGCGADLTVDTSVNEKGAGQRAFHIYVSQSDLEQVSGGEPALTQALKAAMPQVLTMSSSADESGVQYTFTMDFKNIDELKQKSAQILGFEPQIRFTRQGSPFAREYVLEEDTDMNAYFQWAIDAAKPLVSSENQSSMVETVSNKVLLPGWSDFSSTNTSAWSAASTKSNPVKRVEVETAVSESSPARTVTVVVNQDTVKAIDQEEKNLIPRFLKEKTKVTKIKTEQQNGTVRYTFTLEGNSPAELAKKCDAIFGAGAFTYDPVEPSSFFRLYNRYHFADRYDFTSWLGASIEEPLKYVARFNGPMVDAMGTEVNGGAKELKMEAPSGYVNAEAYVKELSWVGLAALAVLVLLVLGIVIVLVIYYRRNPEKVKGYAQGVLGQVAGPKSPYACPSCGTPFNPGDKFCSKCGANIGNRCPQCGLPNKPGDKFCYACGTQLVEALEQADGSLLSSETGQMVAAAEDDAEH